VWAVACCLLRVPCSVWLLGCGLWLVGALELVACGCIGGWGFGFGVSCSEMRLKSTFTAQSLYPSTSPIHPSIHPRTHPPVTSRPLLPPERRAAAGGSRCDPQKAGGGGGKREARRGAHLRAGARALGAHWGRIGGVWLGFTTGNSLFFSTTASKQLFLALLCQAFVEQQLTPDHMHCVHNKPQPHPQAIGSMSRATGYRLGAFLPRALPLVIACYRSAGEGEADDELRDHCLQVGLDFLVLLGGWGDCRWLRDGSLG